MQGMTHRLPVQPNSLYTASMDPVLPHAVVFVSLDIELRPSVACLSSEGSWSVHFCGVCKGLFTDGVVATQRRTARSLRPLDSSIAKPDTE